MSVIQVTFRAPVVSAAALMVQHAWPMAAAMRVPSRAHHTPVTTRLLRYAVKPATTAPSEKELCGTSHCYDPSTEQCCGEQGACLLQDTCCTYQCCRDGGHCAADGFCVANTCTVTETDTFTSTDYITTTITKFTDATSAFKFSCFPLSVTNSASSTLELGTDCGLTLLTPTAASSSLKFAKAGMALSVRATPHPRAETTCLITDTEFTEVTVTTPSTITETTSSTTTPVGFSCLPLTVTDAEGDTLALNSKCQLKFSPGSSAGAAASTSATQAATATAGGSQSTNTNAISGAVKYGVSSSTLYFGLLVQLMMAVWWL